MTALHEPRLTDFSRDDRARRSCLPARFGGDDATRRGGHVCSDDVRFRTKRKQHLARTGDEDGGAPGLEGADDIPRVRRHHPEFARRDAKLACDITIRLRSRLEAFYRIDRKGSLEEFAEARV